MNVSELYDSYFKVGKSMLPYSDSKEHLGELFSFLDLCFAVVLSAKGYEGSGLLEAGKTGNLPGLSVSTSNISGLISPGSSEGISKEATDQVFLALAHITQRVRKSAEKGFFPRFEVIRLKFNLDDFESFALLLSLSPEYDRKYESIFSLLHNNSSDFYASKWLSVKIYESLFGSAASSKAKVLDGSSPLCRFLCSRELKKRDRSEISGRLVLSRRVTCYLLGTNYIDPLLEDYCFAVTFRKEKYIPFREDMAKQISSMIASKGLRDKGCFVVNLWGPEGIGRTTLAFRAASAVGLRILKVRLGELLFRAGNEKKKYIDMIYTETVLKGAIPCFSVDASWNKTDNEEGHRSSQRNDELISAAGYISRLFSFVFWLTPEKDYSFNSTEAETISFELPMLTANERYMFWQKKLPDGGEELMSYANRYILTPKTIENSAGLAAVLASSEGKELGESHVIQAVRQHSVNQLGGYATKINAVFTWDDLVVGDEQKHRMKMICDQVRYRSVVNEDWGFRKGSPYGRGLCALFYGSPGTGKTMAVQVMANELGLDAYRIDLSQLTSKYIGETQKNISRLFDKAKNINAMLFFDEADSMFAKRSEVKDANDRYANADTAFLLQKLEDHEGITILATNYINNIDDAFKRRIKFMINFVFPSPEVRLELWNKILPSSARVDEPLDFEFYAGHFELSGSNIKEILTNAAYLAASEGCGIRNSHIIEAIKLNFSKYGKILTNADFDYLGR